MPATPSAWLQEIGNENEQEEWNVTKIHKPRSGSIAFYPRVRAARETPFFTSFPLPTKREGVVPLNFLGYKAGMLHAMARNEHKGAVSFGQEIFVPVTVVECPPMKVYGVRAYRRTPVALEVIGEVTVEKVDKHFLKRQKSFKKRHGKEGKASGKGAEGRDAAGKGKASAAGEKDYTSFEQLEKRAGEIAAVRLLVEAQPSLTTIGKKAPELTEMALSGSVAEQLAFAREKLGKEVRVSEMMQEKQFVDVKAVNKGKGFEGPVKRFGVKTQRPKAKKQRIVGSIGPWNPSTVMYTVARAGQMGYHPRTEFNKRVLAVGGDGAAVTPKEGFPLYGEVRNDYVLLAGSIPGPSKRAVALRFPVRKTTDAFNVSGISLVLNKKAGAGEAEEAAENGAREEKTSKGMKEEKGEAGKGKVEGGKKEKKGAAEKVVEDKNVKEVEAAKKSAEEKS